MAGLHHSDNIIAMKVASKVARKVVSYYRKESCNEIIIAKVAGHLNTAGQKPDSGDISSGTSAAVRALDRRTAVMSVAGAAPVYRNYEGSCTVPWAVSLAYTCPSLAMAAINARYRTLERGGETSSAIATMIKYSMREWWALRIRNYPTRGSRGKPKRFYGRGTCPLFPVSTERGICAPPPPLYR